MTPELKTDMLRAAQISILALCDQAARCPELRKSNERKISHIKNEMNKLLPANQAGMGEGMIFLREKLLKEKIIGIPENQNRIAF